MRPVVTTGRWLSTKLLRNHRRTMTQLMSRTNEPSAETASSSGHTVDSRQDGCSMMGNAERRKSVGTICFTAILYFPNTIRSHCTTPSQGKWMLYQINWTYKNRSRIDRDLEESMLGNFIFLTNQKQWVYKSNWVALQVHSCDMHDICLLNTLHDNLN
jgi:hypothetical protein